MSVTRRFARAVFLAATVSLVSSDAYPDVRTWTDSTGEHQTEAELVDLRDGVVRLKRADGQVVSIDLETLSAADQAFVKQHAGKEPQNVGGTVGMAASASTDAAIELLGGATVEGRVTARDGKHVTLETTVAGRTYSRKYALSRIRAITVGGKREVVSEPAGGDGGSSTGLDASAAAPLGIERSPAEIQGLIDRLGRTPPDWWDSVPLDFPKTLDLSWPQKPPPPWNAQKNVGQYLWDVIQPNPGKWREGVRFVHYLLERHQDDREKRTRAMTTLGRLYYLLLQDYARAAFWWRQAGVGPGSQSPHGVNLADCYWKLGNRQMALDLLDEIPVYYSTIKLLADMGETTRALRIAEAAGRGPFRDMAYLYAGDACRIDGQYQQAIAYYQKVLDVPATGRAKQRIERNHQRARANVEGIKIFDMLDLDRVADGTYRAASPGYADQVHVEVTVRSGRIESVRVTGHKEKQYYTALTDTPRKIIEKQGVKGVDATTSATITSEAILNATAKALASGLSG
ncbi:MAG TPA: SHD1 domain-containing protein [Thermoguttaceae bacterium]|nr:SHD1 domain-containing protein [Thermoguttaceae bacterium]